MRLEKLKINQRSGGISVGNVKVSFNVGFEELPHTLSSDLRLIYGNHDTGKYGLKDPVSIFGETFRVYFRFQNGRLQACIIELISGAAASQREEYPGYEVLEREVEYLLNIFLHKLSGNFSSEHDWKKVWRYPWGQIVLMQEIQSSQVITDISWL